MKEIMLDNTLKPQIFTGHDEYEEWEKQTREKLDRVVSMCGDGMLISHMLTERDGGVFDGYHANFLEYVELCYAKHYGVIVSPNTIWYTILGELAIHVKENIEHYRHLFTTSNEKVEISIPCADPEQIDLKLLLDTCIEHIPIDSRILMPRFSTETFNSRFAHSLAFLDTVSPYYNYSMYLCGIPKIQLTGKTSDWIIMEQHIKTLSTWFDKEEAQTYLNDLIDLIGLIRMDMDKETQTDFWSQMFYLRKCGSGHTNTVEGWITTLYMKEPEVKYTVNYSTHISQIKYKNLDTGRNFKMSGGLFNSQLIKDYLKPDFGFVLHEIKEK